MRIIAPMMIFIMMTATLAGCTGDDEPRLSKEELVEQIRNGGGGDLTGVDLSGADLSGLQNLELFGIDFTGTNLQSTDFTNSDLSYSNFIDANLKYTKFSNTNLEGATFSGNYSSLTIRDSNLKSSIWDSGVLDWVRFENVDLSFAVFGGRMSEYAITLDSVWFTESTFYNTKFNCFENEGDVRFYSNSISEMYLTQSFFGCGTPDWSDTHFQQNSFTDVDFQWGNFDDAVFFGNSVDSSSLSNNDFTTPGSETVFTSYFGSSSHPQTFIETWLTSSTFYSLGGEGTSFSESSLSDSTFIYDGGGLSEDISWSNTICPDGTNSDENENTCKNNL